MARNSTISDITRITSYVLIAISLIMFLHEFEIINLNMGFDKILVCAILIFLFEGLLIAKFVIEKRKFKSSDIFGFVLFIIAPILYILIFYAGFPFVSYIQLLVVVSMLVEAAYALGT